MYLLMKTFSQHPPEGERTPLVLLNGGAAAAVAACTGTDPEHNKTPWTDHFNQLIAVDGNSLCCVTREAS